ncbi:MAG: sigma-70 family RNA polymerase sigma factor [Myxococcota bacterium]
MGSSERAALADGEKESRADVDIDDRDGFYRSHLPYVLAVLTRGFRVQARDGKLGFHRVSDPTEAEDLTQETFAAFFHQVENGNFERGRPPTPYLRRIATNLALRRAGRRAREVPLDQGPEPANLPPSSVEDLELKDLMRSFREGLPEREKALLECLGTEELRSQAAMGERLGLSRDQVYRSLVSLRKRATVFFREKGWLP